LRNLNPVFFRADMKHKRGGNPPVPTGQRATLEMGRRSNQLRIQVFAGLRCFMDGLMRSMHPAAMNVGVDAKGYQILVVWCGVCGHSGHVDPKRATPGRRFRCRQCRSRRCEVRRIWHEGLPPDNVVSLKGGRGSKKVGA
jgi:hypothetical protein